jgi:hypothetical protein
MSEIAKLIREAADGHETILEVADLKDGQGRKVVVERRQLQPERAPAPRRQESLRRAHEFAAISGFIEYLLQFPVADGTDLVLFADAEAMSVFAVLNETAEHGREVVTCRPMAHPRWKPWKDQLGQALDLDDFVDFLRDNRKTIVEPDGAQLMRELSQVRASAEVTLDRGRGAKALNALVIKTRVQGTDATEPVDLPESLVLQVPLFVDEAVQRVELDLMIEADRAGDVQARLSSADIRTAEIEAFEKMVQRLQEEVQADTATNRGVVIAWGRPKESAWQYLDSAKLPAANERY